MKSQSYIIEEKTTSLELAGRHRLVVERGEGESVLRFLSSAGQIMLSIHVGEGKPVLRFEGDLEVRAAGALELEAEEVAIRGRKGVRIESGADARIAVAGDLTSEARIQNIRARLGNVNVNANDDVRLRGERIRLNC